MNKHMMSITAVVSFICLFTSVLLNHRTGLEIINWGIKVYEKSIENGITSGTDTRVEKMIKLV